MLTLARTPEQAAFRHGEAETLSLGYAARQGVRVRLLHSSERDVLGHIRSIFFDDEAVVRADILASLPVENNRFLEAFGAVIEICYSFNNFIIQSPLVNTNAFNLDARFFGHFLFRKKRDLAKKMKQLNILSDGAGIPFPLTEQPPFLQ